MVAFFCFISMFVNHNLKLVEWVWVSMYEKTASLIKEKMASATDQ